MRSGSDVTLVAFSKMVGYCLKAAELLEQEGISAEVVNLRSLKPIDRDAIAASVRKTHRLVSVEEGWPQHGVGSGEGAAAASASPAPPVNCEAGGPANRRRLGIVFAPPCPPHPACRDFHRLPASLCGGARALAAARLPLKLRLAAWPPLLLPQRSWPSPWRSALTTWMPRRSA